MSRDQAFEDMLAAVRAIHPRFELTADRFLLWKKLLAMIPTDALMPSIEEVLGTKSVYPKPSDVVKAWEDRKVGEALEHHGNPLTHFDGEPRFRDKWGEGGQQWVEGGSARETQPAPAFLNYLERAQWRKVNGYYDFATPFHPGQFVRTPTGPILPTPPPEFQFFQRADSAYELHLLKGCTFPDRASWAPGYVQAIH